MCSLHLHRCGRAADQANAHPQKVQLVIHIQQRIRMVTEVLRQVLEPVQVSGKRMRVSGPMPGPALRDRRELCL